MSDKEDGAAADETHQKVLEYYRKYSQNKELRKYFSGSPAEYLPRIEADEENEEKTPSRASSVMSRKLEWDNMADIGYDAVNTQKSKNSFNRNNSLKKSSSLPNLSNQCSGSSDLIILIGEGDSESSSSDSSSENRLKSFASTLKYLKQKIGNPDAQSTPKLPEIEMFKPRKKESEKKLNPMKKARNFASLENLHLNLENFNLEKSEIKNSKSKESDLDDVKQFKKSPVINLNVIKPTIVECLSENLVKIDKNSQTDVKNASKSIQTDKLSKFDFSKSSNSQEFEICIEKTKETNEQILYFKENNSNSTTSSSVTSKCNSFEFKKAYSPSSSQIETKSLPKAVNLSRSQRQTDLSALKSKNFDSDTEILLNSIISLAENEHFNKSNREIHKNLNLLEKLIKSKKYDEKSKKIYIKKIIKKIYDCLESSLESKSSSSSDLFCPKKNRHQKIDENSAEKNFQSIFPAKSSKSDKFDKSEDEIIPIDTRQTSKKLTRFTLTNNEFSVLQSGQKSDQSTMPSSGSNFNSTSSDSKKNYENWRDDKTLSEQLLEKDGDFLVHFAKKERENQLQWISNEINHLSKLKSLLQKDLSTSDSASSKIVKKTTTYSIKNNKNDEKAKNFVIETELMPAQKNDQIEFKIGENRYTVKELSETDKNPSENGEGDKNRFVNEILINESQNGTTKLKINTICKACNKSPCICVDQSFKNVVCFCNNENCICKPVQENLVVCKNCQRAICVCYDYSFQFVPKAAAIRPATFPRNSTDCPCGRRLCNCDLIKRIEDFCKENLKDADKKSEKTQTKLKHKFSKLHQNDKFTVKDSKNNKSQTCNCKCNFCHSMPSSGTSSSTATTKSSSNKKIMTNLSPNVIIPRSSSNFPPSKSDSQKINEESNKNLQQAEKLENESKPEKICACCNRKGEMAILISEHRYPLCQSCLGKNPGVATVCYDQNEHVCTCFTALNSKKLKSNGDAITISDSDLVRVGKSTDESSDVDLKSSSSSIASQCTCYDFNNSVILSKNKNKNLCKYCRKKLMATAKTEHGIAYTLTIENDRDLNVKAKKERKKQHLEEIKLKIPHPYGLDKIKKSSSNDKKIPQKLQENPILEKSDSKSSVTKTLEIRDSNLRAENQSYFPEKSFDKLISTPEKKVDLDSSSDGGNLVQEKSLDDDDLKILESSEISSKGTTVQTDFSSNGKSDRQLQVEELTPADYRSDFESSDASKMDKFDDKVKKIDKSDKSEEIIDSDEILELPKKDEKKSTDKKCKCKCKQILKNYLKQANLQENDSKQVEMAKKARKILDERSKDKEKQNLKPSKTKIDYETNPTQKLSKTEIKNEPIEIDPLIRQSKEKLKKVQDLDKLSQLNDEIQMKSAAKNDCKNCRCKCKCKNSEIENVESKESFKDKKWKDLKTTSDYSKEKFNQKADFYKNKLDIVIPRMDQDLDQQIKKEKSKKSKQKDDLINSEIYQHKDNKMKASLMKKSDNYEKFTTIAKIDKNSDNNDRENRPITADQILFQTKPQKSHKIIQNNFDTENQTIKSKEKNHFPIYANEIYDSSNKKVQTKTEKVTKKTQSQNGLTDFHDNSEDSSLRRHLQKNRPKFLKNAETRRAIINACKEKRMRDMEQRRLDFYNLNKDKIDTKICQKLFTDREMKEITRKNYEKLPEVRLKVNQQRQRVIKDANKLIMDLFTEKLRCYALKGKRDFPLDSNVINLGNNIYENIKS